MYNKFRVFHINSSEYIGSAVQITIIFENNLLVGDLVSISIKNASNSLILDNVSMTKVSDNIYQYVYDSSLSDPEGYYTLIVKLISGTDTIYDTKYLELKENPLND